MPVLLIGLLFNYGVLVQLGIILFSTVALFQLVTLPVEFDASAKALRTLDNFQILEPQETKMAGKAVSYTHLVKKVEELSPKTVENYSKRLHAKLQEVLQNNALDEQRIITEVAIFAEKIAVA